MTITRPLFIRIFTITITVIVTAVALTGLFLSGSPVVERMRRLDTQRVNDLQQISYALDSYWGTQQKLPTTLDQLQTSRDVFVQNIRDPQTALAYEYRITSTSTYELCAGFETSSDVSGKTSDYSVASPVPIESMPRFWTHGAGRTCFAINIRLPNPPIK